MRGESAVKKGHLLDEEIKLLTEEVLSLKLDSRVGLDLLKLELAALKMYMAEQNPNFRTRFQELRERVRLELNPE